jgi:hypothetical protein
MTMEADWNTLGMDMNLDIDDADLLDPSFQIPQFGMESSGPLPMQSGDYFTQSQDLLALGLQEPLPPQEMMDELYVAKLSVFVPLLTSADMRYTSRGFTGLCQ